MKVVHFLTFASRIFSPDGRFLEALKMLPRALIFALALIPAVHLPSASAFSLSILYPAAAPVLQARSSIMPHVLPLKTAARLRSDRPKAMQVAMVAASTKRGALSKALNKASGALTVSVGVSPGHCAE